VVGGNVPKEYWPAIKKGFETSMVKGVLAGYPLLDVKVILEPIMKLDVFTPEDHVGDVIGDLNRRRGMIQAQETAPTGVRIKAEAALSEMFGYIGDLRTMTSGRGQFSMEFSHYAACPKNIADTVIKEAAERDAK